MNRKDAYEQKMQARLDEWSAEIDRLSAKANKAEAQARINIDKQIESARAKRDLASARLAELKDAGEDAWEDLKQGIESAWAAMESSAKAAKSRFA